MAEHGRARSRAWIAPVRAVSRIWTSGEHDMSGVHPPSPPVRSAIVNCGLYIDGVRQPGTRHYAEALDEARTRTDAFVWLGLHEPSAGEMAGVADAFGLHELAAEDAVNARQRPKLEQFGKEVSFLVLRTARYVDHEELTETSDVVENGLVMMFIGDQFVIPVRHGAACELAPVRAAVERRPELLKHGPWAVAYGVADNVVDLYIDVADRFQQDVDAMEDSAFARHGSGRIQRTYHLKRELMEFKRAVVPLQRPMATLAGESSGVPPEVQRYFRDVQDHLTRTVEQVTVFDDLLNSILQARLAQVTVEQNNDMRKIAAWAAIAASQTLIAGIYGMNFRYMPELEMRYGYPVVFGLMVLSA